MGGNGAPERLADATGRKFCTWLVQATIKIDGWEGKVTKDSAWYGADTQNPSLTYRVVLESTKVEDYVNNSRV